MVRQGSNWQSAGAAAGGVGAAGLALAATACCAPVLAPLVVSVLGVSGSIWAAGLKPYSWAILGVSGILVGYGFWTQGRPAQVDHCEARPRRWIRLLVWLALATWLLAAAINALQWTAMRQA